MRGLLLVFYCKDVVLLWMYNAMWSKQVHCIWLKDKVKITLWGWIIVSCMMFFLSRNIKDRIITNSVRYYSHSSPTRRSRPKENKIVLFGLGPHARRIYYPLVSSYEMKLSVELSLVVDLESNRETIENYLKKQPYQPKEIVYLPDACTTSGESHLCKETYAYLSALINKHIIRGAIISTEPLAHKMYANFALENDLSILMDKPITVKENVISDINAAEGLIQDYNDLKCSYLAAKNFNPDVCFLIQAQRRFHPAYLKLCELIEEVSAKVNIPVTSVQSYHCDGEWRTPFEMADQHYHSYNQGYGKLSHSGYHSLDIAAFLVKASYAKCHNKGYDTVSVNSSMVRATDIFKQFNNSDYKKLYGQTNYNNRNPYHGNEEKLYKEILQCGEVDCYTRIHFKQDNSIMTTCTLDLLHNGFSNRAWLSNDGRDLYKGNGRVRHESHIIQQGPFQSLHLHAYQSQFDPTETEDSRFDVGGVDHLDIIVYRNPLVQTKDFGRITKLSIKDINIEYLSGYSGGHQEDGRARGFFEFIRNLEGIRQSPELRGDFLTHETSVKLMTCAYKSNILEDTVTCDEIS